MRVISRYERRGIQIRQTAIGNRQINLMITNNQSIAQTTAVMSHRRDDSQS
jgi:hypothetical protein